MCASASVIQNANRLVTDLASARKRASTFEQERDAVREQLDGCRLELSEALAALSEWRERCQQAETAAVDAQHEVQSAARDVADARRDASVAEEDARTAHDQVDALVRCMQLCWRWQYGRAWCVLEGSHSHHCVAVLAHACVRMCMRVMCTAQAVAGG